MKIKLRSITGAVALLISLLLVPLPAGAQLDQCTTDAKVWLILNEYAGVYQLSPFYLVAESAKTQVWVQANLAWPSGDPRLTPEITCDQAQYLLSEFDNNIYPTETTFFAPPDYHDGSSAYLPGMVGFPPDYYSDVAGRQVVLISNIRDDNYYDASYDDYTRGFYSSAFETYFDRNVISIDAYDWLNRLGPDGSKPYFVEGVVAYEYQHLLDADYDPDEENFVKEGLANFAVYLTGYGVPAFVDLGFTAKHPENSLVVWGDQGEDEIQADHGQAFLFQIYMYEQFGAQFIQAEFLNPLNGISGIDATLQALGFDTTFGDVYHNYSVAALIDDSVFSGGRYGFKSLDFKFDIGTLAERNPEAYDTPGAPPWGTDYILLDPADFKNTTRLLFNGKEYQTSPTAWTSDGDILWSGTGNLLDNWAIFETIGGGPLSFDTLWDLEDYWDFGFVQVSTDGGHTWTSLSDNQGYSTSDHDPAAHPTVVANLPGLTSWVPDWVTLSYDLSAYAGQNILVAFRMVSDWATYYGGWWIDNVYVDGTLISDGSDASVFKDITEVLPIDNDFTVTFVSMDETTKALPPQVISVNLGGDARDEEDGLIMQNLKALLSTSEKGVMLVTLDAPTGFTHYGSYTYDIVSIAKGPQ